MTILPLAVACSLLVQPAPTIDRDGQPWAEFTPPNHWTHLESGEHMNPNTGEIPLKTTVSQLEQREDGSLQWRSQSWALDASPDGQILVDGAPFGRFIGGSSAERASGLLAIGEYRPPAEVGVSLAIRVFGQDRDDLLQVTATPDGRLLRGRPCGSEEVCPDRPDLGTWTERTVRIGHWSASVAESIDETLGVRPGATGEWTLKPGAHRTVRFVDSHWLRQSASGSGVFETRRSADRDADAPIARAAFIGAARLVELREERLKSEHSTDGPPAPPPPAPRMQREGGAPPQQR